MKAALYTLSDVFVAIFKKNFACLINQNGKKKTVSTAELKLLVAIAMFADKKI